MGGRHCITFAILVDRCNYSEFYFDVVNTKSTILKRTLLKSIKDFNPKLQSYPNVHPYYLAKQRLFQVLIFDYFLIQ